MGWFVDRRIVPGDASPAQGAASVSTAESSLSMLFSSCQVLTNTPSRSKSFLLNPQINRNFDQQGIKRKLWVCLFMPLYLPEGKRVTGVGLK